MQLGPGVQVNRVLLYLHMLRPVMAYEFEFDRSERKSP